MIKYILLFILAIAIIGGIIGGLHMFRVSGKNKREMSKYSGSASGLSANLGKVLIIYYSWTGNTKDIAERIQKVTNGDMYEVQTAEDLEKGPMMHLEVKRQLKTGEYPAIIADALDLSGYDTVFVGAPVWWYTVATPMLAFLEQTDFGGKRVVPFSTQGSNYGKFFEDFKAKTKNANILAGESFNNMGAEYSEAVDNKTISWLNTLGK